MATGSQRRLHGLCRPGGVVLRPLVPLEAVGPGGDQRGRTSASVGRTERDRAEKQMDDVSALSIVEGEEEQRREEKVLPGTVGERDRPGSRAVLSRSIVILDDQRRFLSLSNLRQGHRRRETPAEARTTARRRRPSCGDSLQLESDRWMSVSIQ